MILSGIKTALKGALGGSKFDVNKAFSTIAKGVGNLSLPPQEAAELTAEFAKSTQSENSERSKARRFIAKVIVINTIVYFWVCFIVYIIGLNVQPLIDLFLAFKLGWAFVTTIVFYLGGYYAKMMKSDNKNKRQ